MIYYVDIHMVCIGFDDVEIDDIRDCVNQIVTHITDGNGIETEVTSVMGGEIFELHSEKIIREAKEEVSKQYQKELEEQRRKLEDRDKEITALKTQIEKLKNI